MICLRCQNSNPEGSKFCNNCGHLMQAQQPEVEQKLTLQIMPSGELRVVTVLFADLKGFTSFSEGRDPEEIRDIIDTMFKQFRDLIFSRGGHVDKYIGDAVMAIFGAPDAHEDDPVRAIDAAVAMQQFLREFNEQQEVCK